MANHNDNRPDSRKDSILAQSVDSALEGTHSALGATPGEIFWAAVAVTLAGFFLVNFTAGGSMGAAAGYVAMGTGAFAALALRRKI